MIIYIHGFGSSGLGKKASILRDYFMLHDKKFIAPSLPTNPALAMQTLQELVESYDNVKLIGSSLGGYYAMYLAEKYSIKAVLINPSIEPYVTLNRGSQGGINFYDFSRFEWNNTHLSVLKNYKTQIGDQNKILLMVQKADEVLNYQDAIDFLPYSQQIVVDGGSHEFDDFESYLDSIDTFLALRFNEYVR
jgi:predicted esterase YcpF (UPF0227 family)